MKQNISLQPTSGLSQTFGFKCKTKQIMSKHKETKAEDEHINFVPIQQLFKTFSICTTLLQ